MEDWKELGSNSVLNTSQLLPTALLGQAQDLMWQPLEDVGLRKACSSFSRF